jgi:hypothetical protein
MYLKDPKKDHNYDWEIHKGTLEKKLNKSYSHFSAGLLK